MTARSVVVTGSSSGIGRGIVGCLLADGWAVVGLDQHEPPAGSEHEHVGGDVRNREDHARAADAAMQLGTLRGWVNCAGIAEQQSVHEATEDHLDRVLGVNLAGVFWGCSVAVERMLGAGGSIVNISSGQALRGRDGYPAYAATKGGILSLTTQLAAEYADRGIRCNALVPGVIATEMNERILAESSDRSALERSWDVLSPIGRWGTPADVAEAVRFLLSDAAGFITGVHLSIDGGQMSIPPDYGLTH